MTARTPPPPGTRYGHWIVLRDAGIRPKRGRMVEVRCECGKQVARVLHDLQRGATTNCGCKRRKVNGSFYLGGVLHRDADGTGPRIIRGATPTPGGTLLPPEVVEHMRRYGVTKIVAAEVAEK